MPAGSPMIPFSPLNVDYRWPTDQGRSLALWSRGQDSRWSACAYVRRTHWLLSLRSLFFVTEDDWSLVQDHIVRLWDVADWPLLQVMNGHLRFYYLVAYSLNGTLVASGAADRTVRVWNAATGVQVGEYTGHSEEIRRRIRGGRSLYSVQHAGIARSMCGLLVPLTVPQGIKDT